MADDDTTLKSHDSKLREIETHFREIMKLLGFDTSESATEQFAYDLEKAVNKELDAVEDSHKEGLCLDAVVGLAMTLLELRCPNSGDPGPNTRWN